MRLGQAEMGRPGQRLRALEGKYLLAEAQEKYGSGLGYLPEAKPE